MATITIETKVTYRHLMKKSKSDLAHLVLMLMDSLPDDDIKAHSIRSGDLMLLTASQISSEGIDKIIGILNRLKTGNS